MTYGRYQNQNLNEKIAKQEAKIKQQNNKKELDHYTNEIKKYKLRYE